MKLFFMFGTVFALLGAFGGPVAGAVDVEITDTSGTKMNVKNFQLHVKDRCQPLGWYTDSLIGTSFHWEVLPIDDGIFIVWIPFSLVARASVQAGQYTLTLHDGHIVKGRLSRYPLNGMFGFSENFIGSSDLGDLSIAFDKVRNISFKLPPMFTYDHKPPGKTQTSLKFRNGVQMELSGTAFVKYKKSPNGCYNGEEYVHSILFKTGAAEFQIPVNMISAIRISPISENSDPEKWKYLISTRDGKDYEGTSPLEYLGVEGITKIGTYRLRVIIPFLFRNSEMTLSF